MLLVLGHIVLSGPPFPCPQCNKQYQHRSTLKLHMTRECGKEPSLFCGMPMCTYKTKIKGNLKRHIITRHGMNNVTWK